MPAAKGSLTSVVTEEKKGTTLRREPIIRENSNSTLTSTRGKIPTSKLPTQRQIAATPLSFGSASNVVKSSLLHKSKGGAIGPRINNATAALAKRTNSVDRVDFTRKDIIRELHLKVKPGDIMESPSIVKAMASTEKVRYRLLNELKNKVPTNEDNVTHPSMLKARAQSAKKHDGVLSEFKMRLISGNLDGDDDSIVSVFAALALRKSLKSPCRGL